MEVLHLVDRLDDMVRNAPSSRMGAHVRLDRQEAFALLDEMRQLIPEEIRQARFITGERAEMLAEAKLEADRILSLAREERSRLLAADELGRLAEQRAAKILEMAGARADQIRLGGEGYADEILGSLETGLSKLATVERVSG